MRPLPYDYVRCAPQEVDDKCRNCRRWLSHPEQKNNPTGQVCVSVKSSKDKACIRIPISLMEETNERS